jgi:hypothetical protein
MIRTPKSSQYRHYSRKIKRVLWHTRHARDMMESVDPAAAQDRSMRFLWPSK